MRERPILLRAPMVRALLSGTKTQTRRVCKLEMRGGMPEPEYASLLKNCPYGQPGDRLWVRETHSPQEDCILAWERWLRGEGGAAPIVHYAADFESFQNDRGTTVSKPFIEKWRPSIHMPRWASRITLEITGVRVERLQQISEADAIAEGVDAASSFQTLWNSLHGPGAWGANPSVWVVEFKRVETKK